MRELITQSEFARRAGVTRQAVHSAIKDGLIVREDDTGKIDPENPRNRAYIIDSADRRKKPAIRKANMKDPEVMANFWQPIDLEEELAKMRPRTLKQAKVHVEIAKIAVDIRARLSELIHRPVAEERLKLISDNTPMFRVLPDRVAGRICTMLGRPEMREAVREIIAPEIEKIIKDIQALCARKI